MTLKTFEESKKNCGTPRDILPAGSAAISGSVSRRPRRSFKVARVPMSSISTVIDYYLGMGFMIRQVLYYYIGKDLPAES